MRITALAGGVGGARFLRGLHAHFDRTPTLSDATVTVIGNTGDDINLFGLRVCPDLDTIMYTLGGAVHQEQGWGRAVHAHGDELLCRQGGIHPDPPLLEVDGPLRSLSLAADDDVGLDGGVRHRRRG